MDQRHAVDDLVPQDLGVLPIPRHLLLDALHAALLAVLRVEGVLRVVLAERLAQLQLSGRVALPGVSKALLGPGDELPQASLELLEVQEVTEAQPIASTLRHEAMRMARMAQQP